MPRLGEGAVTLGSWSVRGLSERGDMGKVFFVSGGVGEYSIFFIFVGLGCSMVGHPFSCWRKYKYPFDF